MGSSCSKVCKKSSKRYEKDYLKKKKRHNGKDRHHNKENGNKHKNQQATNGSGKRRGKPKPVQPKDTGTDIQNGRREQNQPVDDESNVNYAINKGGTAESNTDNDEQMKENNYIRPNIGDPNPEMANGRKENKDETKKTRKRRKKTKHNSESDDSSFSWTSSSSSSSSSSSDDDKGKTTHSRQKKKNKDGSVTYITNKTTIGSSKISFKAAKGVNIYHNRNNYYAHPKPEKKRFTQEYTTDEAKVEEQKLYSLFRGKTPGNGQFMDLRGHENVQTVFYTGVLYDCAEWVGQIVSPSGTCTCFRVGTKYIMTALHALTGILRNSVEYRPVQGESESDEAFANLHRLSEHDIFVDFKHLIGRQNRPERNKFHFKHIERKEEIPFIDTATDTVVLELQEEPKKPFPFQFTNFGIPVLDKPFHLITHSNGNPKEFDKVCKMLDLNHTKTVNDIDFLKKESSKFLGANNVSTDKHPCEIQPYDTLANQSRVLFNCSSTKGASGSPGVQVTSSGRVIVVTMLLHGYPDWYYDSECEHIRADWPKEYTVEQGVNFSSVYLTMRDTNTALCNEIFGPANEPRGSTIHTVNAVPPSDAN